ncbi:MAG: hypothetical protein GY953_55495 [bacterium]|nr:hypothetical protein [bacterium]
MAKDTLVGIDLELGSRVLALLDEAKLPITAALWLLNEDYGGWRLLLASPIYDKEGPRAAYLRVLKVLAAADPELVNEAPIWLLGTRHRLVRELRRIYGGTPSVEGMRLGGHSIGDVWVEDGFVYRIRK